MCMCIKKHRRLHFYSESSCLQDTSYGGQPNNAPALEKPYFDCLRRMDRTPMASWPSLMTILASAICFALFGSSGDVLLFASAGIWQLRSTIINHLLVASQPWPKIGLAVVVLSAGIYVSWISRHLAGPSPPWKGHGKVMLLPCRTTHSRLFPKKHSFSYSYLVAGIPVGWEGSAGTMVSTSNASQEAFTASSPRGRSWYHVDARDHLERGSGHLGLRGKLDAYLKSQVCASVLRFHSSESTTNGSFRGLILQSTHMHTW